ncbi:MAG: biliverdin-producing heme oxygenase [Xanthomonadales bacterium]|nr:biliverdin-producing heme oxygenase [Xanthomonadales bacterium]
MSLPMSSEARAAPDPLLLLRQSTRAVHDAVEALPAMRRLFAVDYTLDEYRMLLLALWPFLESLEAELFSAGQRDRVRTAVSRAAALRQDLRALGAAPAEPPAVVPHGLPLRSESQRAGVLYVLEGSSLGGQLIRRALLQRFGEPARDYCHYFDCHAGEAGRQWRNFGKAVRSHPTLDTVAMTDAAQLTFERFTELIGGVPVLGPLPPAASGANTARCPFARTRELVRQVGSVRDRLWAWMQA